MAVSATSRTEVADQKTPAKGLGGLFAAFGAISGLGALAASSCCVLPVVLGGLGAGAGVFTTLEALAPLRVPLLAMSVLAVAVGWWFYARRRQIACEPGMTCGTPRRPRVILATLGIATVLVATAAAWGSIEPSLLKLLRAA